MGMWGGGCLSILWELKVFFFEDIHEGWDGMGWEEEAQGRSLTLSALSFTFSCSGHEQSKENPLHTH